MIEAESERPVRTHRPGPWTPAVIIPAYDEGPRIKRTLARLFADGVAAHLVVKVVCNGCHDDTAEQARAALAAVAEHRAEVIDIPAAGKANAIRVAEADLPRGPRVVLDADAGCDGATVQALLDAVDSQDGVRESAAVAVPRRTIVVSEVKSLLARSYYLTWREFPWVRSMVSGRAAYALSWEVREPEGPFPLVLGDDRWAATLVPRAEVCEIDRSVDVYPVGTLRELIAVRSRVYRGNLQSKSSGVGSRGSHLPGLLAPRVIQGSGWV